MLPALAAAPESAFAPSPRRRSACCRMLRTVRHQRNRRRWIAAAATTLAAACLVLLTVVITGCQIPPPPRPPSFVAMTALVPAPISATADVSTVAWGTKIKLTCTYNNQVQYPATDDYALMVVDKQGVSHELGTWQIVPGRVRTTNRALRWRAVTSARSTSQLSGVRLSCS